MEEILNQIYLLSFDVVLKSTNRLNKINYIKNKVDKLEILSESDFSDSDKISFVKNYCKNRKI